jgi:hypothetical protein
VDNTCYVTDLDSIHNLPEREAADRCALAAGQGMIIEDLPPIQQLRRYTTRTTGDRLPLLDGVAMGDRESLEDHQ